MPKRLRKKAQRVTCFSCKCVVRIAQPGLGPDRDGAYCPCGIFHRRKASLRVLDEKMLTHELQRGVPTPKGSPKGSPSDPRQARKKSRNQKRREWIWAGESKDDIPLIGMSGYELKETIDVGNRDA